MANLPSSRQISTRNDEIAQQFLLAIWEKHPALAGDVSMSLRMALEHFASASSTAPTYTKPLEADDYDQLDDQDDDYDPYADEP